jgi:hypothetical protein
MNRKAFGPAPLFTVNDTELVRDSPPPVPVIVIEYVPVVAEELALNVSVDVPEPGAAMLEGLNVAVTPDGMPEAESATAELKLPLMVEETLAEPVPPCARLTLDGEAESEKFAGGGVLTV